MYRLMQLELRKNRFSGIVKGAVIANICILLLIILIGFDSIRNEMPEFANYEGIFEIMDAMVRATFIIIAGVLLSKLIIDEYKNKTVTLLFMYPIHRKKLIIVKLMIVIIFTFLGIVISALFLTCAIYLIDRFFDIVPGDLTWQLLGQQGLSFVTNALAASFMGLIPLYFGLRKQSIVTTLVGSILIVALVCSNNGGFALNTIIIVPFILSCIGAFIGYLSIRNIEKDDVMTHTGT